MSIYNNIKNLYWGLPCLSDRQKEFIFNFLRKKIRGEQKGIHGSQDLEEYVRDILAVQSLNNEFSIDFPKLDGFSLRQNDPRLIAYYLPQFYPDPHNELWWGKGTTEWTNVSKSMPQYIGHYQPRLPGELGYYDLRIRENIERQVELAKIFGIYGFCYYFYWFNGERLLNLPFENFMNDENIDFPFCICWVNESWTRQWGGISNAPLITQDQSVESYKKFIESCIPVFERDNYIQVDSKPVLIIYKSLHVPEVKAVLDYWRDYVYKAIGKELYIVASMEASKDTLSHDYLADGYDASSEFAPGPQMLFMKKITESKKFVCDSFQGVIYDYKDFVEKKGYFSYFNKKQFRAVCPMWDNTARRKNSSTVLDGATPALYRKWLVDVIRETLSNKDIEEPFIFINAWNEWAEGAYLEPDLKWKYGYLKATRDAIIEARNIDGEIGEKLMISKKKDWNCNSKL